MELTRFYHYQSEAEARGAYCLRLLRFLGIQEGSAEHQSILDDYNTLARMPGGLPRGHKAVKSDDWCAIFAAGQAHAMLMTDIYPMECSCSKIIEIAKAKGIWIESDEYIPVRGDWVLFAWKGQEGQENTLAPNHIGTIYFSDGEIMLAVEGNKGNAVGVRSLKVGDKRIRGFVHPDYSQLIGGLIAPQESGVQELPEALTFRRLDEVPEDARPTIAKLVERGLLRGVSEDNLGLTVDLTRALVVLDRAHAFDNG